jgi:hypothetical protein
VSYSSNLQLQELYDLTLAQSRNALVEVLGFSAAAADAQMQLIGWTWAGLAQQVQTRYTANGTVVAPGKRVPGEADPAPAAVLGLQELSVCEPAPPEYKAAIEFAERVAPLQAINRHNHFHTFGASMLVLLRMATGAFKRC